MEKLGFDDQVIVITGAGQGVGRAYALELARRGARIVVNDLGVSPDGSGQNEQLADRVVREIQDLGGDAVAAVHSVATVEGGQAIINCGLNNWGRVDAVIHNAGILRDASFLKMSPELLEPVLAVHLRGAFNVAQPAFRIMKESGRGGRIVLTTSSSGLFGMFGQSNYAAAKMGLVGLTRVLAIEGAKANIKVNAIAPTAGTRLTGGGDLPESEPLSPAHLAPLAVVLCHASCPSSGEIFQTGGGWVARVKIDLTQGYVVSGTTDKAEELLQNWDAVRSGSAFEPKTAFDLAAVMQQRLGVSELKY